MQITQTRLKPRALVRRLERHYQRRTQLWQYEWLVAQIENALSKLSHSNEEVDDQLDEVFSWIDYELVGS